MDYLPIFVGCTAAAVVLQAGILVAMYLAVRQSTSRMEALSSEVKTKILPAAELAHSMLMEFRPQLESIISNVNESSGMVRAQMERLDATISDVIDRTRLQVIRADEFVSRTMDRVEHTTDVMHETVVSPVRQMSGLIHGVSAAFEFLFAGRRRERNHMTVPQDEMFI